MRNVSATSKVFYLLDGVASRPWSVVSTLHRNSCNCDVSCCVSYFPDVSSSLRSVTIERYMVSGVVTLITSLTLS